MDQSCLALTFPSSSPSPTGIKIPIHTHSQTHPPDKVGHVCDVDAHAVAAIPQFLNGQGVIQILGSGRVYGEGAGGPQVPTPHAFFFADAPGSLGQAGHHLQPYSVGRRRSWRAHAWGDEKTAHGACTL